MVLQCHRRLDCRSSQRTCEGFHGFSAFNHFQYVTKDEVSDQWFLEILSTPNDKTKVVFPGVQIACEFIIENTSEYQCICILNIPTSDTTHDVFYDRGISPRCRCRHHLPYWTSHTVSGRYSHREHHWVFHHRYSTGCHRRHLHQCLQKVPHDFDRCNSEEQSHHQLTQYTHQNYSHNNPVMF